MTTFAEVEVKCAVCGTTSSQRTVGSTSFGGPPDLDTRPAVPLRATYACWMMECPRCGYAAPDLGKMADEAPEIVQSEAYKARRTEPGMPALAGAFRRHAVLLEAIGAFASAGWTNLHAAWACDDESNEEAARRCRLDAIRLWRHGKNHGQNFVGDHAQEFALATDVLRRAGEFDEAKEACLEALQMEDLNPLIEDVLRMQLTLIQQRDTRCHSVREVLDRGRGGERVTLQ